LFLNYIAAGALLRCVTFRILAGAWLCHPACLLLRQNKLE
jgi:hypothetical protein